MSCVNPVTISTSITRKLFKLNLLPTSSLEVPCGKCINCRIVKQSQLSFLCGKEMLEQYKAGRGNSFVTLTYDDDHIPRTKDGNCTLVKSDLQKFMKRIRRNLHYHYGLKSSAFKYLACGEYGDSFGRCHFHICFFGLSTEVLKAISRKVWKFGICDIGVLTSGGVRYVCKYLTKSNVPDDVKILREELGVENPFICHSFGLGKEWILKNMQKIVDDKFQFNLNGKICFYPKYILRFVSFHTGVDYRKIISESVNRNDYKEWRKHPNLYSVDDYRLEHSKLVHETNIAILRSKGIPIDPKEVSRTRFLKPVSKRDRHYVKSLVSDALLKSACVPF